MNSTILKISLLAVLTAGCAKFNTKDFLNDYREATSQKDKDSRSSKHTKSSEALKPDQDEEVRVILKNTSNKPIVINQVQSVSFNDKGEEEISTMCVGEITIPPNSESNELAFFVRMDLSYEFLVSFIGCCKDDLKVEYKIGIKY